MRPDITDKQIESNDIAEQTREFLSNGGKITKLKSCKTIEEFIGSSYYETKRNKIKRKHEDGKSIDVIAYELGYSKRTVKKYLDESNGNKKDTSR